MIVAASKQDCEAIYSLMNELEAGALDHQDFIKQYEKCMADKNVFVYLYKDDEIKGGITLYIHHYLHHRQPTGEIGELIVKEKYRNQHIGEQLLRYVEERAVLLGLEEISLSSGMKRIDAHRFYERHDYIKDHFCFEKKLDK